LQGKKFFFFFSLALVSSFGRRLEEEGDGFGKLKSLQGISTHPTHSPNCAHSSSSSSSLGSRWVVGS
jgi:hypothetical protein